jgi:hypothetical protein
MIQRGYHRKHHKAIYKIGRTNDFHRRINEYPAYSLIICVISLDNDKKCERELIRECKNDIGHEYFEGDERYMISVFNDYASEHLSNREEDGDMD